VERVRPFFDGKHRLHFGSLTNSGVLSSVTWPISDLSRNARKKRRFVQKSIRTGRATATRRRRQAAARLAFHCAHRVAVRICESPLRLVHGRHTSCVDRVPSASKKELSRPLEAVMDPTGMGLNFDDFLDQPFKTQNEFQNDQIRLSNSSPRRHTKFRLSAAAPQIVAKHRRRRRRLSGQAGKRVITLEV